MELGLGVRNRIANAMSKLKLIKVHWHSHVQELLRPCPKWSCHIYQPTWAAALCTCSALVLYLFNIYNLFY